MDITIKLLFFEHGSRQEIFTWFWFQCDKILTSWFVAAGPRGHADLLQPSPGSATWGRRSRPCPYSPIQYWNNLTVSQGDSRVKPALVFLFSIQQTTTDSRYNNSVHWQLFFFTTIFSQHWNISSNYSIFIAHSQSLGTQIILCDHWQESHHYRKSHLSNVLSDTWLLIRTEWRQMKVRPLYFQK